ncbi:hypothetical protein ACIPJS_12680 [Streptomyces sp. NPDC086783]|uniref:hypothetical protein n=1 Tax=Streptomyces sp. NPDC086783 TaxID=3365758 RepID=UPI00382B4478
MAIITATLLFISGFAAISQGKIAAGAVPAIFGVLFLAVSASVFKKDKSRVIGKLMLTESGIIVPPLAPSVEIITVAFLVALAIMCITYFTRRK